MTDAPDVGELTPPNRTLMGPGPSDAHPRVLRAMSTPLVGHLDPSFIDIMNEVQDLMRYTFRTDNQWTIPVSGTGSASMEAAIGNLVEPGDTVLVPTNGYFGGRMESMAERAGGNVVHVDAPWGEPLDSADVQAAFDEYQPDVFGFVHAETSTGVKQPSVPELTGIAHDHDALVIADCVTSLGGVELEVDDWGIDVAYAGPQKCLSCPPGASPLTLNDRAMDKVLSREEPPRSWYLDLSLLEGYWGDDRSYHHTAPITNVYAIREALRLVAEEGIENRWDRHRRVAGALKAAVEAMGLGLNPEDEYWLPSLNAVLVPDGVHAGEAIDYVLEQYDLEIAGGLGALAGDIFRIGCMGYSAQPENVSFLITALSEALEAQDADVDVDTGFEAMRHALAE
ncbi:alanine--glyoxylate aminotransferase family protein [Haloferax mediterranei ATCC 33500]|uniref:Alanine--glyoxylate aminotransferase family protein n=2 Tax=Haloferax mediterranei (strain ATCC 33500 / DSM 1411 / JCM 8866 / NBRC 14739 / NCIMB 2177 / R-4) TaxID=523841 RepID=I3R807_HALMT|nr:aminotransferase class V [Haloferax mediterranei ATCC 33500]ELZ99222.1 class V aminotransferase [Haloferax mediterranei ATCC 33500]QCQ76202.1 alanine--glyoxylate aminotransferase family protein [Haloferax mediterranei ATCC 33500]